MSQEPISTIEQLVAAREARGMSIEDMLRQLKLAPRQLRALEEGDWQALPGLAFTRAVLRSYGRALGVDVGPLVGSMAPSLPEADLKPASTLHQPMPARSMLGFGSGGGGNRLAWMLLIVLGVVALALFFGGESNLGNVRSWLSEFRPSAGDGAALKTDAPAGGAAESVALSGTQAPKDKPAASEPTASRAAAPAPPAPVPQAATPPAPPVPGAKGVSATKAGDASPATPASQAAPATGTAAAASTAPSGAPGAKPAPGTPGETAQASPAPSVDAKAAEAGRRVVKLVFQRDSWVEVRDADGNVVFTGTQKGDTDREFTAKGPVSMIIGNAEFVRAEVDGKPFDLVPHTRAAIARVTLR